MGAKVPTRIWALAQAVVDDRACLGCGAARGDRCRNLRTRDREELSVPHAVRYPAGDRNISSPANAALLRKADTVTAPQSEDWLRASWMQTYTGMAFRPWDCHPTDIDPADIAHALSQLCRFGGHTKRFYSVAEHAFLVSEHLQATGAPLSAVRWGLMHDAAEAYLQDLVRPVKQGMAEYRILETQVLTVIAARFDLPLRAAGGDSRSQLFPDVVNEWDNRILLDERAELLTPPPTDWVQDADGTQPLGVQIRGWYPPAAERMFLRRMDELGLT